MCDASSDEVDGDAFAARCGDDRHHFRFIVSPEDASEMADLCAFTRELLEDMASDLDTSLDWVAVDHWNTDNPHVHLLVRGVDDHGADLVINRDYISHNLRSRAEELAWAELGPKPEHEIQRALERERVRFHDELELRADQGLDVQRREAPGGGGGVPRARRILVVF